MINKNAQVGSTVTWMAAFVVIFFLLILYFVGVGFLAGTAKIFKNEVRYIESDINSLASQRSMLVLLNSEFNFLGSKSSVRNAIEESVNFYIDDDLYLKLVSYNLDELSNVDMSRKSEVLLSVFSDSDEAVRIQNENLEKEAELRNFLMEELNDECYSYFFKFPLFEGSFFKGEYTDVNYDSYKLTIYVDSLSKSFVDFEYKGVSYKVKLYKAKSIAGDCK